MIRQWEISSSNQARIPGRAGWRLSHPESLWENRNYPDFWTCTAFPSTNFGSLIEITRTSMILSCSVRVLVWGWLPKMRYKSKANCFARTPLSRFTTSATWLSLGGKTASKRFWSSSKTAQKRWPTQWSRKYASIQPVIQGATYGQQQQPQW